jgi:DNA (cytosine-5)-methyltransferase 1
MAAYYNELDPYAAQWLRNLIAGGHIAPGEVDERSIHDVRPADVAGYDQCHWFAGIGGWSYALRLAGWPDERPVWTGSCPCQPFSAAGQRRGTADDRHLWPVWFNLIRECRPAIVFGEQVAAAIRGGWLDAVLGDLEAEGYATGAAVLGAHSVGAPHLRQRLWFVADADAAGQRLERGGGLFDGERAAQWDDADGRGALRPWSDLVWLPCTDGKARPTQPGIFPLAHGAAFRLGTGSPLEGKSRVGMLRAAGNCIVPQAAAAFITAAIDN